MNQIATFALQRFEAELKASPISVIIDKGMPPALGHEVWVEEVFANLISNAIKYRDKSSEHPQISIRGYQQDEMNRYEVIDNGIGIPVDKRKHIFDIFTRLEEVHADGHGLGLSIVLRIIRKLNGDVGVENTSEGTCIWFTLPHIPNSKDSH